VARPPKSLAERVRDGTFLARRHADLLNGPRLRPKALRELQADYKAAASERERRALALDFQERAREMIAALGDRSSTDPSLAVAAFFPENLRHQKGPAAGQPFRLEPWQREFVDELYRLDERGNRIYKRAILGVPRGNGKSPSPPRSASSS